ncbi:helix-turn-helix domain-containing protein [Rhodovibrionaceae bacterium A322]
MPKDADSSVAIERHVGQRIRHRRTQLGLTQQQLAEKVGVTYQQAHKYEKGINRISAGRLFQLAQALAVEVGYFYEGLENTPGTHDEHQRMSLDLSRNFAQIKHDRSRDALAHLCRAMAQWDALELTDPEQADGPAESPASEN